MTLSHSKIDEHKKYFDNLNSRNDEFSNYDNILIPKCPHQLGNMHANYFKAVTFSTSKHFSFVY